VLIEEIKGNIAIVNKGDKTIYLLRTNLIIRLHIHSNLRIEAQENSLKWHYSKFSIIKFV